MRARVQVPCNDPRHGSPWPRPGTWPSHCIPPNRQVPPGSAGTTLPTAPSTRTRDTPTGKGALRSALDLIIHLVRTCLGPSTWPIPPGPSTWCPVRRYEIRCLLWSPSTFHKVSLRPPKIQTYFNSLLNLFSVVHSPSKKPPFFYYLFICFGPLFSSYFPQSQHHLCRRFRIFPCPFRLTLSDTFLNQPSADDKPSSPPSPSLS